MDIKSSQKKVDVWIKKYGVRYFDIMTNMAILTEEVGEVARVISREYGEQSKKKQDESLKLSEELSDVLFVVFANDLIVPPLFGPVAFTIAFSVIFTSFSDKKTTFPPTSWLPLAKTLPSIFILSFESTLTLPPERPLA